MIDPEVLREARNRMEDKEGWVSGYMKLGNRYCALGRIKQVICEKTGQEFEAVQMFASHDSYFAFLHPICKEMFSEELGFDDVQITTVNDSLGREAAIQVLEKAIVKAEEQGL